MRSVIFTSYFSRKKHPNDPNDPHVVGRTHDGRVIQNDISYIKIWYESVKSLNIEGRIFCDDLNEDFIKEFSTDKISFVKVEPSEFSNNDWRFFCYKEYLKDNKFDAVFLTDGSDVKVVKDPMQIVEDNPDYDLFVGKDSLKLEEFPYLDVHRTVEWEDFVWFSVMAKKLDLINMGVIGGKQDQVENFLNVFWDTRVKLERPEFNSDMWTGQYVFRHLLSDKKILIGEPLTSDFKKYQNDRTDVFFIHK